MSTLFSFENLSPAFNMKKFMSFALNVPPSFNERVTQIILEKEPQIVRGYRHTTVAGIERGTTSAWKNYNVLTWNYPEFAHLRTTIAEALTAYAGVYGIQVLPNYIQCWCNVLRGGEELTFHSHSSANDMAGVYYVTGEDGHEDAGCTFYNVDDGDTFVRVTPNAGVMNMFQGDLHHFTSPHTGGAPRISIAFDIVPIDEPKDLCFIELRDSSANEQRAKAY